MKQNKVTSIDKNVRKFWVTRCPSCSGIDGIVEQIKTYDSTRDRHEWDREGRKVTEYTQVGKAQIPWCDCLFDDELSSPTNPA